MNLNQTLQEKYPHLEISVLKLSEAQKDNESKRIDSEYFKREYLENIEFIKSSNFIQLINTDISIKHPMEIKREYTNEINSVWFFRTQNLRPLFIDNESNKVYISEKDSQKLQKNIINKGDILITRTGANFGDCAIYNLDELAIASSHILIVRNSFFNQSFLAVFLNTKFGKIQINKGMYGGLQPEIAPYYLKNIYVPILPMEFQLEIEKMLKDSHKALEESKELYKKAEETLYNELGLDPKTPLQSLLNSKTNNSTNSPNISIRTLKESFLKTGRLDSEYYQEKYETNEKIIMNKNYTILDSLVNITKSIEPGSNLYKNKGVSFIRVANLTQYGLSEPDVFLDEKDFFPQYLQTLYPKKDTILFSKDGSVGIAYCVEEDKEIVTSGAILHLNIKDKENILPEYLTLFLNSIFVKLQAQRDCGGSIISHWRIEDIKKVLVVILDIKIQEKIAKYIQESFNLRKKSKQLLDNAKIKVEEQIQGKV